MDKDWVEVIMGMVGLVGQQFGDEQDTRSMGLWSALGTGGEKVAV